MLLSLTANAQATDLVVDNQNPGLLSGKINYGDQLSVKNLKVTGYINSDDLAFMGMLIQTRNLNGRLDLHDCNIVRNTTEGLDNYMGNNCFNISEKANLNYLSLPKTLEKIENILYLDWSREKSLLEIDTIHFDCNIKYIEGSMFGRRQYDVMPHHIIVGNKVDSIPNNAFDEKTQLSSIKLPASIKYVGNRAFYGTKINKLNFNELVNLEYLGHGAFAYLNRTEDCKMQ